MKPIFPNHRDSWGTSNRDRRSQRWAGWPPALFLINAFLLSGAPCQVAAGIEHDSFFAEPGSGRKVTHYTTELPINRDQRQTFVIPDDCLAVLRAISEGSRYQSSIADRRLWQKVEIDCHFDGFLHQHAGQIVEDYVSDYDFMNARLSDLPINRRCSGDGRPLEPGGCLPVTTDIFGMPQPFPLALPSDVAPDTVDPSACELRDGLFNGRIYFGAQGIKCESDPHSPGMRLIAVDFADVNGDQVLDAVLRLVPLGPGASRAPLILPLTRKGPDEPFSIPEVTYPSPPMPPMPPMPPVVPMPPADR